jgi:hypothetical protein
MGALRGSAACFPRQRTVRNISITKIAKSGKTHKKVFFHTPRDNDNDRKKRVGTPASHVFCIKVPPAGAVHSILLQEVVVTANKPRVPEDIFETWSQKTIDYEEIERKGISSLEDVLRHLPGIIVKNGQAYLMRGGLQAVGFFIDGTYFETMKAMFDENPDPVYTVEQQAQYHTMTQGMSMTIAEYTRMNSQTENVMREIEDLYPLSVIKKYITFRPTWPPCSEAAARLAAS